MKRFIVFLIIYFLIGVVLLPRTYAGVYVYDPSDEIILNPERGLQSWGRLIDSTNFDSTGFIYEEGDVIEFYKGPQYMGELGFWEEEDIDILDFISLSDSTIYISQDMMDWDTTTESYIVDHDVNNEIHMILPINNITINANIASGDNLFTGRIRFKIDIGVDLPFVANAFLFFLHVGDDLTAIVPDFCFLITENKLSKKYTVPKKLIFIVFTIILLSMVSMGFGISTPAVNIARSILPYFS